jgi:hypothetical protein
MQREQQQREEKGFQDEVAVIHRLVQTHLVTKPEDDPEYSTSEHCERAPCCSTKSSAGLGYTLHDEVEQLSSG